MRGRRGSAVRWGFLGLAATLAPMPAWAGAADAGPTQALDGAGGNPLWHVPVDRLSQTRDRPPFAPTRRPPPPVAEPVVAAPVVEAPPEKPLAMTLVGVVRGIGRPAVALLLDEGGQTTLRLKTGDQKDGWTVTEIRSREVVMKNGTRESTLGLVVHAPNVARDDD